MTIGDVPLAVAAARVALSRMGAAHLEANEAARSVSAVFHRRWSAYLSSGNAEELTSKLWRELDAVVEHRFASTRKRAFSAVVTCVKTHVGPLTLAALHDRMEGTGLLIGEARAAIKKVPRAIAGILETPSKKELEQLVPSRTRSRMWRELLGNWEDPVAKKVGKEIEDGIRQGKSTREIAKDIQPFLDDSRTAAMRIARTGINQLNRQMQRSAWKQTLGPRGIDVWLYLATLDLRTRKTHAALDHTEWSDRQPWPKTLDEWNCRCAMRPKAKQFAQFGLPENVRRALARKDGERAAKVFSSGAERAATLPRGTTYETWFNDLPAAQKREIIGNRTYDQLSSGRKRVKWGAALEAYGISPPEP